MGLKMKSMLVLGFAASVLCAQEVVVDKNFNKLSVGSKIAEGISAVKNPSGEGIVAKFEDKPDYKKPYFPLLQIPLNMAKFQNKAMTLTMDMMMDKNAPADFVVEFRGPKKEGKGHMTNTFIIMQKKNSIATRGKGSKDVCKVALGQWFKVEYKYDMKNPKTYSLKISDASGKLIKEITMPIHLTKGFNWFGIVGHTKATGAFYLNNLKIVVE